MSRSEKLRIKNKARSGKRFRCESNKSRGERRRFRRSRALVLTFQKYTILGSSLVASDNTRLDIDKESLMMMALMKMMRMIYFFETNWRFFDVCRATG